MQSTNSEGAPLSDGFAAAVTGGLQQPISRLRIGWGGDTDFSGDYATVPCTAFTAARQLAGDLPDVVKTVEGFSSSTLDAALASFSSEGLRKASWWYSRFNTESPLFGLEPLNSEVTADIGARTDAGPEYVRKFTGTLRGLTVRATATTVAMNALDYRLKLAAKVQLPMIVGAAYDEDIQPNLSVNWILNEILQANGICAVPPNREQCVFSASLLGSTWPSVGTLVESNYTDGVKRAPTFVIDGPFGPALDTRSEVRQNNYHIDQANPIGPQPGQAFLAQGWVYAGEDTGDGDPAFIFSLLPETNLMDGSAALNILNGQIVFSGDRAGESPIGFFGQILDGPPAWHFIGVHMQFTETQRIATINLDGVVASGSVSNAAGLDWGPDWLRLSLGSSVTPGDVDVPLSAWQVTAEPEPPATWDDAFEPTAVIERSTNDLVAITPSDAQDSWNLIKDISSTEFATFFFDEHGIFRWWPTTHWSLPETQEIVREVTAKNALIDITYKDTVDQIRNMVRVNANPVTVQPEGFFWEAAEVYEVPGLSSIEIWANFENPVWQLITDNPAQVPVTDRSYVEGWDADDDTGTRVFDYTIDITAFATAAKIVVENTSADTMWILGEITGDERPPGIKLFGKPVVTATESAVTAEVPNAPSIALFGERSIDVPATRWRQTRAAVETQAAYLGAQLSSPRPVLTEIPIIGDPRLQLGDRIRIVDRDGLALDGTYRITGIKDEVTPSSYTQTLTARLSPDE